MHRLILFFLSITLISCSENEVSIPDEIISEEQMVQILADMHIADAAINYKAIGDTSKLNNTLVYSQIFSKHSVSVQQYRESYRFYLDHPALMSRLYDQVINELSRRQSGVGN